MFEDQIKSPMDIGAGAGEMMDDGGLPLNDVSGKS